MSQSPDPTIADRKITDSTQQSNERAGLCLALRGLTLEQVERIAVECAIVREGGSLPAAARSLGVSPSTLYRKRERWGISAGSAQG